MCGVYVPTASAVGLASPVTILTSTDARASVATASRTPSRGGSHTPHTPVYVRASRPLPRHNATIRSPVETVLRFCIHSTNLKIHDKIPQLRWDNMNSFVERRGTVIDLWIRVNCVPYFADPNWHTVRILYPLTKLDFLKNIWTKDTTAKDVLHWILKQSRIQELLSRKL